MSRLAVLLAAALLSGAAASVAHAQDVGRGRLLYENHCIACHSGAIHGRAERAAHSRAELEHIVTQWQGAQNLRWSRQDIEDVVEYLDVVRYKF